MRRTLTLHSSNGRTVGRTIVKSLVLESELDPININYYIISKTNFFVRPINKIFADKNTKIHKYKQHKLK